MSGPRRYALGYIIGAAGFLVVVAVGNFVFDAAGIFHLSSPGFRTFVKSYVARLRRSEMGLFYVPYERSVKMELARTSAANCFVTGSSRHMSIGKNDIPQVGKTCSAITNVAVSGGTFEDLLIFMHIFTSKDNVRRLYIGIDPWMLSRHRGAGWVNFKEEYFAAREHLKIDRVSSLRRADLLFQDVKSALSLDYLVRSLTIFVSRGKARPALSITEVPRNRSLIPGDKKSIRPDGTFVYSRDFLAKTPPPDHLVSNGAYFLTRTAYQEPVIGEFQAVLRAARRKNIEVQVVLMPYHPKVFSCTTAWICNTIRRSEAMIRTIAARNRVKVIGSYDPGRANIDRRDFLDDIHLSHQSLRKAFMR